MATQLSLKLIFSGIWSQWNRSDELGMRGGVAIMCKVDSRSVWAAGAEDPEYGVSLEQILLFIVGSSPLGWRQNGGSNSYFL